MNASRSNSRSINDFSRCQHRTPTGKRCRLRIVNSGSGLCFRHSAQILPRPEELNLRSALAGELSEFQSAHAVNDFLSRLLLLLSENRISPRRGAVLAYVCNLLLRTIPVMACETQQPDSGDGPYLDVTLPPPMDPRDFQAMFAPRTPFASLTPSETPRASSDSSGSNA